MEQVLPLVGMWGLGWYQKHKTKINHKKAGPLVNIALGVGISFAMGGGLFDQETVRRGLELAGFAELGLHGSKAVKGLANGGGQ